MDIRKTLDGGRLASPLRTKPNWTGLIPSGSSKQLTCPDQPTLAQSQSSKALPALRQGRPNPSLPQKS